MVKFQVTFNSIEATILTKWAESEFRDPRDQIHYIVKQELERRGLLTMSDSPLPLVLLPASNENPNSEKGGDM